MKDNNFNSFVMYHDFYDSLEELTNEEAGLLFKAIYNYQLGNEYLTDDKLVNIMLKTLIKTFERDKNKWLVIKEKRSEAAKTRWSNQTKPKVVKDPKPKTPKKIKEPKTAYGEFKNVLLTSGEFSKALTIHKTPQRLNEAIAMLDEYIQQKGKDPYKDHCVILTGKNGWVFKQMDEKKENAKPTYAEPVYQKFEETPKIEVGEVEKLLTDLF